MLHARTRLHTCRIDVARKAINDWLERSISPAVMWSGGKDSTVMAHLALSLAPEIELVSEKDDLDYPGERDYVEQLAGDWRANLTVLEPETSPAQWMTDNASCITVGDDMHGRAAELSKACFYSIVENYSSGRSIMLGLRTEESKGRNAHRASRGLVYQARGQLVAQPIADWTGIDVYAYCLTHGIELLPLYQCVGLMHARDPWRIRKSWWIQGSAGVTGGIQWLRYYYPSLYYKLLEWIPLAQSLGG